MRLPFLSDRTNGYGGKRDGFNRNLPHWSYYWICCPTFKALRYSNGRQHQARQDDAQPQKSRQKTFWCPKKRNSVQSRSCWKSFKEVLKRCLAIYRKWYYDYVSRPYSLTIIAAFLLSKLDSIDITRSTKELRLIWPFLFLWHGW